MTMDRRRTSMTMAAKISRSLLPMGVFLLPLGVLMIPLGVLGVPMGVLRAGVERQELLQEKVCYYQVLQIYIDHKLS